MGWKTKVLIGIGGLSGYEQYKADLKRKGEKMSLENAYEFFGKPAIDKIIGTTKGVVKGVKKSFDEGGMAYARKKNMGLKYKKDGSVSKKKSRGTGAAKQGTKFKGIF